MTGAAAAIKIGIIGTIGTISSRYPSLPAAIKCRARWPGLRCLRVAQTRHFPHLDTFFEPRSKIQGSPDSTSKMARCGIAEVELGRSCISASESRKTCNRRSQIRLTSCDFRPIASETAGFHQCFYLGVLRSARCRHR